MTQVLIFHNIHGLIVGPGLFEPSHMKYEADREKESPGDEWQEPTLTELVDKAIRVLRRGDNGYFLFVEGRNRNAEKQGHLHRHHSIVNSSSSSSCRRKRRRSSSTSSYCSND